MGPLADWSAELADPAVEAELRAALERAIAGLPDEYRAVVLLCDAEELSNEQVAGILDLSLPAVKSRLHRARLALRQVLSEVGTSPRRGRPARSGTPLPRRTVEIPGWTLGRLPVTGRPRHGKRLQRESKAG